MTELTPNQTAGWTLWAEWQAAANPVLFKASWRVPDKPAQNDNQLIFLFNGLQNPNSIVQCMIIFGDAGTYGNENEWTAVCMYAPAGDEPRPGPQVPVSPGDILNAEIRLTGQNAFGYTYAMRFINIPSTAFQINSPVVLKSCCVALESYGVLSSDNYPESDTLSFRNFSVSSASAILNPIWNLRHANTFIGEQIGMEDSDVTIRFRGQALFV